MVKAMVGLELHGYISTKEKLFCTCPTNYQEAEVNTNICPICTGQPGSKPMLPNKTALRKVIEIALMLDCKIAKEVLFQRKHYNWPDLPPCYQRTISGARSNPVGENGKFLGIRIREVHLEEDPARWDPATGYVDYNRSGMPLVEIVTEPDFKGAEETREWLKNLVIMLSYINAIDKTAGIKSDVNVSIDNKERVEVKNINSIRNIDEAIKYEILRQSKLEEVKRETRTFVESKGVTVAMREKEVAADYRFIPDPDLVPIEIKDISEIKKSLPELPHVKAERFVRSLKIKEADAKVLTADLLLADLFEKVAKKISPHLAAKWLKRELPRVLHYTKKSMLDLKIDEKHIIELLDLIEKKQITDTTAQKILEKLIEKPFSVKEYVKKEKLIAVFDKDKLEKFCKESVNENPNAVKDYKLGKEEALHFLMGKVMQKSKGAADPQIVKSILKGILKHG